jgi:hypothetical protein
MTQKMITRETIVEILTRALEPLEFIHALWEGGAAGFGRVDEWSDLDLRADVEDEHVEAIFPIVENALKTLSPIDLKFEIQQPTWHGHYQTFYRLQKASKFLIVDFVVMKHSNPMKYTEREIHGPMRVYFDKQDIVESPPFDVHTWLTKIEDRLAQMPLVFELFQVEVLKELERDNPIDAQGYYHSLTLAPLSELLRIKYKPTHYGYKTRYTYYDLPAKAVARLESLYFVKDVVDLRTKHEEAGRWFWEILAEMDIVEVKKKLQQSQ